ncbi:hypothetical protein CF319_g6755 [Tilletia indica]|nr:hypothetical protein CF319_g6755 [Tilletia indica]
MYSQVNQSETALPMGTLSASSSSSSATQTDSVLHWTTSSPAWKSGPSSSSTRRSSRLLQRLRQKWFTISLWFFTLLVVLNLVFGDGLNVGYALVAYTKKFTWSASNALTGKGGELSWSQQPWVETGRTDLNYTTPFNRDDLTLTEDECDALFPGLWKDLDRAKAYYTKRQPFTRNYLERSCAEETFTQLRVVIYHNRLYVKMYRQSDFKRTQTTLALLQQSIISSREKLPNVEFCLDLQDWGSMGKFSLSRSPDQHDTWLMPDYAYYNWLEHIGGSYKEFREKSAALEKSIGWEGKTAKLFWRGSMKVGTADRESMVAAATGHDWSDVKPLNWAGNRSEWVSMVDHCKWKFHGFAEGNTYSGRLRYLQHCRSVLVTHEPRWIQHWTHLYNANTSSPDQNIVFVPPALPGTKGTPVKDFENGPVRYDTTWSRLPEVMEELLRDDAKAKQIADNQVAFFRDRYISPASATCYWRKALKTFSEVQLYDVDLTGREISYEDHMLNGFPAWPPTE